MKDLMEKPLWTVKDMSEYFTIRQTTIRDWIREGRFPNALLIGNTWRVPVGDIKKFIQKAYGGQPQ
jgi:excisionase family DNA binding protein